MEPISFQRIKSSDAEISYWALGDGPPVILLHPFPVNHEFWLPVAVAGYALWGDPARPAGARRIRGGRRAGDDGETRGGYHARHGRRGGGAGPGYGSFDWGIRHLRILAEASRAHRGARIVQHESARRNGEARGGRLQAAKDVGAGNGNFFESMIQRVIGWTTRETRPDLVEGALRLMRKMLAEDVAQVQRGMAERPFRRNTKDD